MLFLFNFFNTFERLECRCMKANTILKGLSLIVTLWRFQMSNVHVQWECTEVRAITWFTLCDLWF